MRTALAMLALLFAIGVIGCTQESQAPAPAKDKKEKSVAANDEGDHGGYWCKPHGLPEDECWACNDEYAQERKKMGDWCEKHERPQSQCFKCDPKLKEVWAKKHLTKFGTQPPPFKDY